jgi:tetratricopeptide (TPR) repeat protein
LTERQPSQPSLEERLQNIELRQLDMRDLELRGPHIDPSWLRDQGTAPRVERVWQRLEARLPRAEGRGLGRPALALVSAAAVFALGLWVGRATQPSPVEVASREAQPAVDPEPAQAPEAAEPRAERPTNAPAAPARRTPRAPVRTSHGLPRLSSSSPLTEPPAPPVEVAPPVVGPSPAPPHWLSLANRGEYAAAFQAVDEAGGFDVVVEGASAEELMTLADVARAAGQPGRAVQALREVVERDASDPNAPVAAMLLGNLLQRAGDYVGAAEAYALNRRLSPRGDFAEDALARQFEVALERGDLTRARALSAQYETEFPEGRRLGEIRDQLERAESEREAARAAKTPATEERGTSDADAASAPDDEEQRSESAPSEGAERGPSSERAGAP